jgi:hypothetical protein
LPKLVCQPIGFDDTAGLEKQEREKRSLPAPAEVHCVSALDHLNRAEQPELSVSRI